MPLLETLHSISHLGDANLSSHTYQGHDSDHSHGILTSFNKSDDNHQKPESNGAQQLDLLKKQLIAQASFDNDLRFPQSKHFNMVLLKVFSNSLDIEGPPPRN